MSDFYNRQIIEINRFEDLKLPNEVRLDGFSIKTKVDETIIGISSDQNCCEQAGIISTEDNLSDYIGALLWRVSLVTQEGEQDYKVIPIERKSMDPHQLHAIFVNLETQAGQLQFVLYNYQNGYYGHEVVIKSRNLSVSATI